MPAGQLEVASVTAALKPFAGLTVTVEAPVDPAAIVSAAPFKVKLGAAVTVNGITTVSDKLPLVPFTVSE